MMKQCFFFLATTLLFVACQSDEKRESEFVGTYQVTIEAPESKKELEKAKKDMKKEMEEARKELKDEMKKARREIESELGEDSDFGKAIGSFVEGMGHLANSMTDLGESLGEMGIDLGTGILQNISFQAEFQKDGDVVFGKKRGIQFGKNDLKWKIDNGKMYLWNEDEPEKNADPYQIERISENEIDLVGEEVIFHLVRQDQ